MSGESQIIEFPVQPSAWQAYVDMFKERLHQQPDPAGPPIAVFHLPNGNEFHVIRLEKENELSPGQLPYIGVEAPNTVDEFYYDLIPKENRLREPYNILVIGWQDGKPVHTTLRIATYKIKLGKDLIAAEGGVIHNPPFTG